MNAIIFFRKISSEKLSACLFSLSRVHVCSVEASYVSSALVKESAVCRSKKIPVSPSARCQDSAPAVCDNGSSGGHGFQRRDPEILFAGEQESLATRIEGGERFIVYAAHKTDGRPGNAFQKLPLRAIPRNNKPSPGTGTRLHRQIQTLV